MAISKSGSPVQDRDDEVNRLTHKIIGCAMQVHRTLGNGFTLPGSAYWHTKSRFLCGKQSDGGNQSH